LKIDGSVAGTGRRITENWPHFFIVSLFKTAALDMMQHSSVSEVVVCLFS